jgi:hypothetical protein
MADIHNDAGAIGVQSIFEATRDTGSCRELMSVLDMNLTTGHVLEKKQRRKPGSLYFQVYISIRTIQGSLHI